MHLCSQHWRLRIPLPTCRLAAAAAPSQPIPSASQVPGLFLDTHGGSRGNGCHMDTSHICERQPGAVPCMCCRPPPRSFAAGTCMHMAGSAAYAVACTTCCSFLHDAVHPSHTCSAVCRPGSPCCGPLQLCHLAAEEVAQQGAGCSQQQSSPRQRRCTQQQRRRQQQWRRQ